jgi:hypothetical protein
LVLAKLIIMYLVRAIEERSMNTNGKVSLRSKNKNIKYIRYTRKILCLYYDIMFAYAHLLVIFY